MEAKQKVMFFGDSLTEGSGVEPPYRFTNQFAILAQKHYYVLNAGKNGDTIPEGVKRLPTCLKVQKPDILCICIGGNDFLKGTNPHTAKEGLASMIKIAKEENITVIVLGFFPPITGYEQVLGERAAFINIYKDVSKEMEVAYLPSIFKDVPIRKFFVPKFNFGSFFENGYFVDDIHPNAKAHLIIAKTIYQFFLRNKILIIE